MDRDELKKTIIKHLDDHDTDHIIEELVFGSKVLQFTINYDYICDGVVDDRQIIFLKEIMEKCKKILNHSCKRMTYAAKRETAEKRFMNVFHT